MYWHERKGELVGINPILFVFQCEKSVALNFLRCIVLNILILDFSYKWPGRKIVLENVVNSFNS